MGCAHCGLAHCNAAPEENAFCTKLMLLLQEEGKSMKDVQAVVTEIQSPKTDLNMELVTAFGKLVDKCNQVSSDDQPTESWDCSQC